MVGKNMHRSTMTRLMVWLLLIAFSICLCASPAFTRQRPYDIKTVTHVQGETDDGGWINPATLKGSETRPQPVNVEMNLVQKVCSWIGHQWHQILLQIEINREVDAQEATQPAVSAGSVTASE